MRPAKRPGGAVGTLEEVSAILVPVDCLKGNKVPQSTSRDRDDLWWMPLSNSVNPDVVDAFLAARVREHEHLDYRQAIDPKGDAPGAKNRLAETVAAMANTGGTGLILVGVSEEGQGDRPGRGWLLKPGDVREQGIEGKLRELDPYVPVEIGRSVRDEGEIVIIRVPDFELKPVFLRERGILIRRGQSNVPATPAEIGGWLGAAGGIQVGTPSFKYNFLDLTNQERPALSLGVTPGRSWPYSRWNDETDEALVGIVRALWGSVDLHVGDDVVRFGPDRSEEGRTFTMSSQAEIIRTSRPETLPDDLRCELERLGVEIAATWAFARAAIPVVRPGFPGPASFHVSIGGIRNGFGLTPTRTTVFMRDVDRAPISDRDNWRRQWTGLALGMTPADLAGLVLPEMLRAFGYRHVAPWLNYVQKSCQDIPDPTAPR